MTRRRTPEVFFSSCRSGLGCRYWLLHALGCPRTLADVFLNSLRGVLFFLPCYRMNHPPSSTKTNVTAAPEHMVQPKKGLSCRSVSVQITYHTVPNREKAMLSPKSALKLLMFSIFLSTAFQHAPDSSREESPLSVPTNGLSGPAQRAWVCSAAGDYLQKVPKETHKSRPPFPAHHRCVTLGHYSLPPSRAIRNHVKRQIFKVTNFWLLPA